MILRWLTWLKPAIMTVKGIKMKVLAENLTIKTKCADEQGCSVRAAEPNQNWCVGCSPDNCSGCGTFYEIKKQRDELRTLLAAAQEEIERLKEQGICDTCGESVPMCRLNNENMSGGSMCDDCAIASWRDRATAISLAVMSDNAYHDQLTKAEQRYLAWEGGEEWEQLAFQLCADERGEESCDELIWEGCPPEPWGERWLKYESEAKRIIQLVRQYAPDKKAEQRVAEACKSMCLRLVRKEKEHAAGYGPGYLNYSAQDVADFIDNGEWRKFVKEEV